MRLIFYQHFKDTVGFVVVFFGPPSISQPSDLAPWKLICLLFCDCFLDFCCPSFLSLSFFITFTAEGRILKSFSWVITCFLDLYLTAVHLSQNVLSYYYIFKFCSHSIFFSSSGILIVCILHVLTLVSYLVFLFFNFFFFF